MITKYRKYIDMIEDSTNAVEDLEKYEEMILKARQKDKENRKLYVDVLLSDYTEELSKYFDVTPIEQVSKKYDIEIDKYPSYDNNMYGNFQIDNLFMVDDDFGFILVPPRSEKILDNYTVGVFKVWANKSLGQFVIRKTSFYVFKPKIDIVKDVKRFTTLYKKSIKPSQKKRAFQNNVDKYNL